MRRTRVLSLALIICLVLGCAVPAYALDAPNVDTARSVLIGDMRSGSLLFAAVIIDGSFQRSRTNIDTKNIFAHEKFLSFNNIAEKSL